MGNVCVCIGGRGGGGGGVEEWKEGWHNIHWIFMNSLTSSLWPLIMRRITRPSVQELSQLAWMENQAGDTVGRQWAILGDKTG